MIELLKSGLVDNSLLCELATHPDFPRLMADLEEAVRGRKEVAEKDCGEIGLAKKSKSTAGEKVKERQI